jgi:hypothetical protein
MKSKMEGERETRMNSPIKESQRDKRGKEANTQKAIVPGGNDRPCWKMQRGKGEREGCRDLIESVQCIEEIELRHESQEHGCAEMEQGK